MDLGDGLGHLTYSTLVHAGDTWPEMRSSLETFVPQVKARVSPDTPFGVSLRLSGASVDTLQADPDERRCLVDFLEASDLYLYTVNAFPHGPFKNRVVKEDVYEPDWATEERLRYTTGVADLLAEISPSWVQPSIQTAPLAFAPNVTGPDVVEHLTTNLLRCIAHLVALEQRTGRTVRLALEPEPACFLETTDETVAYFKDHLYTADGSRNLARLAGVSIAEAQGAIRRHLGVVFDIGHQSVGFEDIPASLEKLVAAGIPIFKLQEAAALWIPEVTSDVVDDLRRFSDTIYLSQTVQRRDGELRKFLNLEDALDDWIADPSPREWRTHFHVPVFLEELGPFRTTRFAVAQALAVHRSTPLSDHLEIETYTWDVLPDELKTGDITDYVTRELEWVKGELTGDSPTEGRPGVSDESRATPSVRPRALGSPGSMSVDYEQRVDMPRLRAYRLERAQRSLEASECGAFLLFDFYNIRYVTQTWIGGALGDKMSRYALLARGESPYIWDFGSAARHHQLFAPWLDPERSQAGMLGLRGAVAPDAGLIEDAVRHIKGLLEDAGLAGMPVGVDIAELPVLAEMARQGLTVVDCQQRMLDAREIKSEDEITLLTTAAAMVDGVYQDVAEALKPGIRENEIVALVNERLYGMGSEQVEAVNAVSGERCNPHPHNFSDRLIRPGDQAFFDIIHSYNGYRTCYYRTFSVGRSTPVQVDAYTRAREWMDAAIEAVKPGVGTDAIARLWPTAESLGFASEMAAFGLQFGHGLGLGLHERPIISRLNSLEHPLEIKESMVFALETYCPATDGISAARIEEEVVVRADGAEVITRFPADELFVANRY